MSLYVKISEYLRYYMYLMSLYETWYQLENIIKR